MPSSKASSMGPPEPLQVQWTDRVFTGDYPVSNPATLRQKIWPSYIWPDEIPRPSSTAAVFRNLQEHLREEINMQLKQLEPTLSGLRERKAATEKVQEVALSKLTEQVSNVETQLQTYVALGGSIDWEPTRRVEVPDLRAIVDERIANGTYQQQMHRVSTVAPPLPPSAKKKAPQGVLPLRSPITTRLRSATAQIESESRDSSEPEGQRESSRPRQPRTPTPVSESADSTGSAPAREPAVAGGGGGDPDDDDSDTDPEPDPERQPKRWRAWVRRTERMKALQEFSERLGKAQPPPPPPQEKQTDFKTPDPKAFKGEADDLDRFLQQLENKFSMEPRRFRSDLNKIRFTGQLLEGKAAKWYKSYHLQISSREAFRVRGIRELDPVYARWDRFEASLRASFGERITRDQGVREWHRLRHTDSIDDFVDEINRLTWVTGYGGEVIEDKLKHGLNEELGKEWAKLAHKPADIGEQLATLRDMGHQLEDWYRRRKPKDQASGPGGSKQPASGGGKRPDGKKPDGKKPEGGRKPKGGGQAKSSGNKSWKEKDEELKGISKDLLDERGKDQCCLKCGKSGHKWFECWCKAPVTTKSAAGSKRGNDGSGGGAAKQGKTAGVKAEETATAASGRVIEIPEMAEEDLDLWAL